MTSRSLASQVSGRGLSILVIIDLSLQDSKSRQSKVGGSYCGMLSFSTGTHSSLFLSGSSDQEEPW